MTKLTSVVDEKESWTLVNRLRVMDNFGLKTVLELGMRMTQTGYHYLLHHLKYETLCKGYKVQNTNAQEGRETKAGTNPQRDLDNRF